MWCLITQPNNVVFEVQVPAKAIGEECLQKVCEHLGITRESDYFGLKYRNRKGEELWLNLRNPIDRQVRVRNGPIRLALRVKFWVPPHLILQDNARHQFYLHAKLNVLEKKIIPYSGTLTRLMALMAQAEGGDCSSNTVYQQVIDVCLNEVKTIHRNLIGMKKGTAEYWFLKELSQCEGFGEETFYVHAAKNQQKWSALGVGPHGIQVYEDSEKPITMYISFNNITSASSHQRNFRLDYIDEENKEKQLFLKLTSSRLANGLYRSITEKHAFYSCETVRSAVTSQFIRDLKGTFISIFNDRTTFGRKYVFDIRKTCREVYDNARRTLHHESQFKRYAVEEKLIFPKHLNKENIQDSIERIVDAVTCKLCMDRQMDAVFLPCGHLLSCLECSTKCEKCPLCRSDVTQAVKVFLPSELSQIIR